MTTQALEAIPEETVTPATPDRVTSDVPKTKPATAKHPKHPSRVASGKRLAERNRLAREAKKQAEAQKNPYNYNHKGKSIHDRTIKQQHKHWLLYSWYWWFDCFWFGCVLPK